MILMHHFSQSIIMHLLHCEINVSSSFLFSLSFSSVLFYFLHYFIMYLFVSVLFMKHMSGCFGRGRKRRTERKESIFKFHSIITSYSDHMYQVLCQAGKLN